jgi:hypothetical protein
VGFRRRGKDTAAAAESVGQSVPEATESAAVAEPSPPVVEEVPEVAEAVEIGSVEDLGGPRFPAMRAERDGGPWDSGDLGEDKLERVDLGGILVPIVDGMELRAEIAEERVVAATLVIGRTAIQIQPFAAPRTMGIRDDVRGEIAEGIGQSGGSVRQVDGRFGLELLAEVPVGLPDGTVGMQIARFLGVDGPRWFLRAVITGEGAIDDAARAPLEDLFADVVVVRGMDPMAPREAITLRLPDALAPVPDQLDHDHHDHHDHDHGTAEHSHGMDDFHPFERGPEITEIR